MPRRVDRVLAEDGYQTLVAYFAAEHLRFLLYFFLRKCAAHGLLVASTEAAVKAVIDAKGWSSKGGRK